MEGKAAGGVKLATLQPDSPTSAAFTLLRTQMDVVTEGLVGVGEQ